MVVLLVSVWATQVEDIVTLANYGMAGIILYLLIIAQRLHTSKTVEILEKENVWLRGIVEKYENATSEKTIPALDRGIETLRSANQDLPMGDLKKLLELLEKRMGE